MSKSVPALTRLTRKKPRQLQADCIGEISNHLLNAACCLLLGRLFPVKIWRNAGTLECLNLGHNSLPRLRSKHSDLHDIAQVVQRMMVEPGIIRTKAQDSSLYSSALSEARGTSWLEEAEHSLPSVVIVFSTTPAYDRVAIEVELEVVE